MGRHRLIDLSRQLDEPRIEVVLLRLPAQIERVDRDAVSAQPRPRIKRMEAERLRRRRIDHLPYIDAHAQRKDLQLIHQRDIYAAIDVLQQLRHLRYARRRHTYRPGKDALIQHRRKLRRDLLVAPNDLRYIVARNRCIARVLALRREGDIKHPVFCRRPRALDLQPMLVPLFQDWDHQLFRRPGISRALQHHKLALLQPGRSGLSRIRNIAQVRLAMLRQRSRHAHNDGILLRQAGEVSRSRKTLLPRTLDLRSRNPEDIRPARLQVCHLLGIYIETCHLETCFGEKKREWQPNIPEPDHTDLRGAGLQALHALLCNLRQNNLICSRHSLDYRICLSSPRLHESRIDSHPLPLHTNSQAPPVAFALRTLIMGRTYCTTHLAKTPVTYLWGEDRWPVISSQESQVS